METFNSLFMVSPLLLGVLFFVAMLAGQNFSHFELLPAIHLFHF